MRRVAVAICLIAVGGCGSDDDFENSYLLMQQPDAGVLDGALDYHLSIRDNCVLLLDGLDGSRTHRAFWPAGTSFDPDTDELQLPGGVSVRDGDRVVGSGGSEVSLGEISDEMMGRVFVESSFTEFARTCRNDEVTASRVVTVGSVEAGTSESSSD